MLKLARVLFIVCIVGFSAIGQDTFIKKIDKGVSRTTRQIVAYENRYLVLSTGICDNITQCCLIMEVDDSGDILWEKTLPWLDVASKSMIIENDTIFLSGNHPSQSRWLWHQMSIDSGDSLATYEIVDEDNLYIEMFNLGQVKRGNQFCIYGPGEIDNNESSLLYFVDHQGRLDTLIALLETDVDSDPWEVIPDNSGNLLAFIRYNTTDTDRQTAIAKIDGGNEVVWTYFSEEDSQNSSVPNGAILNDGRIVFNYFNEGNEQQIQSLRCLYPDGTISWKYLQPDDDGWMLREYKKIYTLSDGNIIGFGEWGNVFFNPIIKRTPWIIKVSDEGELLWQRTFYEVFPEEELANEGFFYDGVELADGSFMVVGAMTERPNLRSKILIARLDAEGCLLEECGAQIDIQDLLSSVAEVPAKRDFTLYPNPTTGLLNIQSEFDVYKIEIFSAQGEPVLQSYETAQVNVSELNSGLYLLKLYGDDIIKMSKFIKE